MLRNARRVDCALFTVTIAILCLIAVGLLAALVMPVVGGEAYRGTVELGPWPAAGLAAVLLLSLVALVRLRRARHRVWRREDAHGELIDSQRRFHATFDSAFQHMALLGTGGHLIEVNQTMLDFAGLEQDDVVGRPFWRTHWWFGSDRTQHQLQEALGRAVQGEVARFAAELRGRGGRVAHVDLSLKPIRDKDDEVVMILLEARDLTARLRGEDLSRQQAQIIDQINSAMVVCDLDECVVSWNQGAQRLFGLSARRAVGQHISMIYPDDLNLRVRFGEAYRQLWKQGWHEAVMPLIGGEDRRFTGLVSLSLLRDGKRRVMGTVAIISDVTRWEGQARAAGDLARLMSETELETLIFEAGDLALVYANPRACEAVGRPLRDLLGTSLTEYLAQPAPGLADRLRDQAAGDEVVETLSGRQTCGDGSVRLVEMRLEPIGSGADLFYGLRVVPVSEEIERIRLAPDTASGPPTTMH